MRRCLFLLLPCLFLLSACGGGSEPEDVGDLLDRAFSNPIESADLTLEAELDVRGSKTLRDPIRIEATGPFRGSDGELPQVDLTLSLGSDGDGQVIETGFLSTGDRAFVKFQDVYYEQPPAEVARTNRELRKRTGRRRSSLAALGLDPRSWLADAKDDGEERVAGVQTRHVSGTLDVDRVLADLNAFVRRSSRALSGSRDGTQPLTRAEIDEVTRIVRDPTFDVYIGVDDDTVRRVTGRIELAVPEADRESLEGIEAGTLKFAIEFRDVNGAQEIVAPRRARPLKELMRAIGGTEALEDALGSTGDEVDESEGETDTTATVPTTPTTPAEPTPQVPRDGEDERTSTEPDAEDFRRYAECLDKARPEDTEALQRCAELLQG